MRKIFLLIFSLLLVSVVSGQDYNPARIAQIRNSLLALETDIPGLSEEIDIALQQTQLSTFLMGISEVHGINIDVNPSLSAVTIINNFKKVAVIDVLIYLCKVYNLEIDLTGTILSIDQYNPTPTPPEIRVIPISYDPASASLFADLQNDLLPEVFKEISKKSGKGIFFSQGMENERLSAYVKDLPFDVAMEKIAFSNNLIVTKTKDGLYEFEKRASLENGTATMASDQRPSYSRRSNFFFEILDQERQLLEVDLENVAIADIVYDIGNALSVDIFTATPLTEAGTATVSASRITFDQLLTNIFESNQKRQPSGQVEGVNSQNRNPNTNSNDKGATQHFTYKKENGVYYFGTNLQLLLRQSEIVPLYYRSIQLLADPQQTGRSVGRTVGFNQLGTGLGTGTFNTTNNYPNRASTARNRGNQLNNSVSSNEEAETIASLIPDDITSNLSVLTDPELNSFIVSGPSADILRFKAFIKKIDKPVPVVMIEVMILDINRSATLEAGVEWGIGERPTTTQGTLFPHSQVSLGAKTVNRILGRIDGASFFNIGKVVPNFYANIKAMETNGILKVRSSPRITTLNGHRAYFSNGETSYYEVTNQSFIGTQNPTTSEITNYQPIDAELSLDVKPFVAADGEITMDIKVIQSSFNGERIAEGAPPGINSREFTSIVKARNNDIIVLGGLEEKRTSNSGSGVPLLARIPILKWLFSKRVREGSKSKLTVLIKPTVIF